MKIYPSENDWERIKVLGLAPGILSIEDYAKAVELGETRARQLAETLCGADPVLPPGEIKLVNAAYMGAIHPGWAIEFRAPELVPTEDGRIWIGFDFEAVSWKRVPQRLEEHCAALRTALKEGGPEGKWNALLDFHMGFVATQPFLDGNKRLARLLTEEQVKAIFGQTERLLWPAEYNFQVGKAVTQPKERVFDRKSAQVVEWDNVATFKREVEKANPGLRHRISLQTEAHAVDIAGREANKKENIPEVAGSPVGLERQSFNVPMDVVAEARMVFQGLSAGQKEGSTNTLGNKIETSEEQDRESVARFEALQEQQRKRAEESVTQTQKHSR